MEFFRIARCVAVSQYLEENGHVDKALMQLLVAESLVKNFACWLPYILFKRAKCIQLIQGEYDITGARPFIDMRKDLLKRVVKLYRNSYPPLFFGSPNNIGICLLELCQVYVEKGKLDVARKFAAKAERLFANNPVFLSRATEFKNLVDDMISKRKLQL